jgi:hypothetical protein
MVWEGKEYNSNSNNNLDECVWIHKDKEHKTEHENIQYRPYEVFDDCPSPFCVAVRKYLLLYKGKRFI